jgi:hypothetical protein
MYTKFQSENPEGTRPFGRPNRKLEDYIKLDIEETGCESMD